MAQLGSSTQTHIQCKGGVLQRGSKNNVGWAFFLNHKTERENLFTDKMLDYVKRKSFGQFPSLEEAIEMRDKVLKIKEEEIRQKLLEDNNEYIVRRK